MKKYLVFVTLFSFSFLLHSQDIRKKYSSMSDNEKSVYFIHPLKGLNSKQLSKKDLIYDITYVTSNDDATFNFTYYNNDPQSADSVSFVNTNYSITVPAKILFVDAYKNNLWKNRISLQVPYSFLTEIYKEKEPYKLTIYTNGGKTLNFEMENKNWIENSGIVNKIFQTIELNRNK